MIGFIKYMRSEEAEYLLSYPNANHLFSVMAYRARRTNHSINGLKAGQCFLGDYSNIGLTERQYRTAKKQLSEWGLATFKGTNKGTVGTIVNTKVYDINEEISDELGVTPKTDKRRTRDGQGVTQGTTNKECNKQEVKNDNKKPIDEVDTNNETKKDKLDWSALQMSASEIDEIKKLRRNAKAAITQRVINSLAKEFETSRKRGYTNDDIMNEWSIKGWRSYKDEWMKVPVKKQSSTYTPPANHDPLSSLRDM